MAPTKSLAEQIADLENTAPKDYDPEDLVEPMGETSIGDQDDSDKEEHDAREHYVQVGKSSLRNQQAFLMDDPRYSGQRKNRKDIYSDQESDDNDDDDDVASWTGFDQQEDLDIAGEDSQDDDEDDSDDANESDQSDEGDNELNEQLKQLQKDEKDMLSQLAKNTSTDIEKGQHVRQQLTLWDNTLETRIRIQKAVELSNQLPQGDRLTNILDKDDSVKEEADKVKGELRQVIDDLMELRTSLLGDNDAIDLDDISYNSRKRHLDDDDEYIDALWNDIDQVNSVFVPFRNSTLEKWSNKVQAASSARMTKKFKAFDQGILTQIDNLMNDKEGLVRRTQLQRAEYKILGKNITTEAATTTKEEQMDGDNNKKRSDRYQDTYDEELFDDNDFYQQQLRELIESRMVDTDDPIASGMRWAAIKKDQVKKKKKNIDTKASKGRKLRFNVHEKIQNFMAPAPAGTWHDAMTEELYSSLLGQRKTMMESNLVV
ncbi:apoptosis antagonizing transcription factor-domain-containing protein [Chlamydoabsidia padenii]|nr:apoptosis antagonizing transcription factor-domain-containing protein [Chlamydoabsidia padenii]